MKQHRVWLAAAISLLVGLAIGSWLASSKRPGAATQVADRAREVLANPDPFERSIGWHAVLGDASADALPALREAVAGAQLDVGDPELVAFAMWFARIDPQAALTWADEEWRARSRLVVGAIFRVWAQSDPETAMSSLEKIVKFHHDAALDAVIAGWQESGKPGLIEWAQSLPDDAARQLFGDKLARRLVLALGVDGAMRSIESAETPGFREMMTMRIASAAGESGDAAAIAAWATPRVTSGEERPSGFPRRIATRWILRDPDAALAWLESLPAGIDRDDGVMESFRDWMRYSPAAARRWIEGQQPERWSEPAFSIHARMLARDNPEEALALVARFSDEQLRRRVSAVIVRKWAAQDPAAAGAWVAKSDLPDDVKALAAGAAQRKR